MDAYYRKTRRPNAALSSSIKRPPSSTEPKLQQHATKDQTNDPQNTTQNSIDNARVSRNVCLASSPAKTPAPAPRPRPTTPTNARIARPKHPPPVRRKLTLEDRSRVRTTPKKTPRDLFRTLHPLDNEEESQDKDEENNNAHSSKTTTTEDVAASFGLKRLVLPATPPATPVKQPARRVPDPQSSKPCPESPSKITTGPLKGVSSSLLDLIRAKEAKAKEVTPEQVRLKELLSIAPEIARIVPTVFTANKKDYLLYDKVVDKCFTGLKTHYTTDTIIECLGVMAKIAPEWVSVVSISKGKFMRYNKDRYTLPQLMVAIQRYQREKGLVK